MSPVKQCSVECNLRGRGATTNGTSGANTTPSVCIHSATNVHVSAVTNMLSHMAAPAARAAMDRQMAGAKRRPRVVLLCNPGPRALPLCHPLYISIFWSSLISHPAAGRLSAV